MQLKPVHESAEYLRIKRLPSKGDITLDHEAIAAAIHKTGGKMKAWPEQLQALTEASNMHGLFAPLGVGAGKTLVCWLLPTVLNAPNAVYLTEAKNIPDAKIEREKYAPHFNIRDDIELKSYDWVSNMKNGLYLPTRQPSLIIADEGHALRNTDAVRTRRFLDYMYKHPEVMFCVLSGTITKRSLKDYGHLADLALKRGSFMPNTYNITTEWAEALDATSRLGPPRPPGALLRLMPDPNDDGSKQTRARLQFRRRMVQSLGVVASEESALGSPLEIRKLELSMSAGVNKALHNLDKVWERPDGWEIVDILDKARILRQVQLGGFYRWKDPTPEQLELLRLRADMAREVNKYLKTHKRRADMDSPGLIVEHVRRTRNEKLHVNTEFVTVHQVVNAYDSMADKVDLPETEWVWIDRELVNQIVTWCLRRKTAVWTNVVEFGKELARQLGVPYYGRGEAAILGILHETGRRSVVASIQAHGEGRNLPMWSDALVLAGIPTGEVWEQLIGRHHRPGQLADKVTVHVPDFYWDDLQAAKKDARYIQETLGNQQKLLMARY